ncbi:MAG: HAMP domain-containing sensor histidine kinase [Gemmatimonadota bacterium]|nr:HAMP domain-containing sensor histidine kinase [Gemmatimonadota bacterium]
MEIVIGLVVAVVVALAVVGFGRNAVRAKERRNARDELERELRGVVEAVGHGRLPDDVSPDGATAELVQALEKSWAPRDAERHAALSDAVGRVSRFLDRQVRAPLAGVSAEADEAELRERIERALGALADVDFFLREAGGETQGTDVVQLSQQVSREFAADHEATVRLQLGASSLRATVEPDQLMDALYLILHNAARFGGGETIDMTVVAENGRPTIRVRDRGPGFTEAAFKRAFDPFYSETEDGLGLGLPHARKTVEAMGGEITLRNVPDGGAEVEVSLPA